MRTRATRRVRPRPSERTTDAVRAPGRTMLPMREPQAGRPLAGRVPRKKRDAVGDGAEHQERCRGRADEDGCDHPIEGKSDGESGEEQDRDARGGGVAPADPCPCGRDLVAEERGRADGAGAAEGDEREGERGERAVDGGKQKLAREDSGDGDRHIGLQESIGEEGYGDAEKKAGSDPQSRDRHDLDEVDEDRKAGRRAEAFQRRDDGPLALEKGGNGVGDSHSADDQRGEADQAEELGETADICGKAGRRVVAGADPPGGGGESVGGGGRSGLDRAVRGVAGQPDAVGPVDEAAGLDKAGRAERRPRDHQARADGKAARQPVGLVRDDAAEDDLRRAEGDRRSDCDVEAGEKLRCGKGAVETIAPRTGARRRCRRPRPPRCR